MRNPNGYGTVYRLKGRRRNPWTARVIIGYKQSAKSDHVYPDYRYIGYYRTRKEAQDALAFHNMHPTPLPRCQKTLENVYSEWSVKHYAEKPKTKDMYSSAWKVLSPLHDMDINRISPRLVENVFQSSGKNAPTLSNAKIVLKALYTYAAKYEWTTTDKVNVISLVEIGNSNPNQRPHKRISDNVINELWQSDDELSMSILFLLYTGVRVSEMLNLKCTDVDLEEHCFFVSDSKTPSGVRYVPIHDRIFPYVKNAVQRNNERLLAFDWLYTLQRPYNRYRKLFMERLYHSPHDCRHTFISRMQELNVPEPILKSIVGHKGKDITESVYTHISNDVKLHWINKLK